MKKTLAMLCLTALALVSLVGCGEKKDGSTVSGRPKSEMSEKKKDLPRGDDMSGKDADDKSITGDGMVGDKMKDAGRRAAAAARRAAGRSRYYGIPSTDAQSRSGGRSLTGIDLNSNDLRYRRMLSNGRVRDTDGFLFDGENTHFNTLR